MRTSWKEPSAYQSSASGCSADPAAVAAAVGPASSSDEERTTALEVRGLEWVHMGRGSRKDVTFTPLSKRIVPKVEGAIPQLFLYPGSTHKAQHPNSDACQQGNLLLCSSGHPAGREAKCNLTSQKETSSQRGPHSAFSGTASHEAVNVRMCVSRSQIVVVRGLTNGWDLG